MGCVEYDKYFTRFSYFSNLFNSKIWKTIKIIDNIAQGNMW